MASQRQWTTTQAARLLEQPPHRIIYLFENHVVEAPEQDPRGRGSSRLLSARNLLELGVATATSRLGVGTRISRKLLDALRTWEQGMAAQGFALPRSIEDTGGPTVRLILDENGATHVAIGWGAGTAMVKGPMEALAGASDATKVPARAAYPGTPSGFGWPEGSRTCRLEINVTAIAQQLKAERDSAAPGSA